VGRRLQRVAATTGVQAHAGETRHDGQHQQDGDDFDEAEAALASLHVSQRLVMSSFSPVPPTWLSAPSEKMSKGAFWPGKR